MSSKKGPDLFRLLTFRLTLLFVVLFLVSSALVFGLAYLSFHPRLMRDLDGYLKGEADEVAEYLELNGLERTRRILKTEAESHGIDAVFFRLISPGGEVIASSDLRHWDGLEAGPAVLDRVRMEAEILRTVSLPGRDRRTRLIYQRFGPGYVAQVGHVISLDEVTVKFSRLFFTALAAMLLCGGVIGWFVVRRSMRGVKRVTRAARELGRGEFRDSLPLKNEGLEIDHLAQAFNDMAARIRGLVGELKEVTTNIAHDLRSPVTRIRGLTEMTLTRGGAEQDWREIGAEVIEECDRLTHLIDTILEIAQARSGSLRMPLEEVDLKTLAGDAVELFQPLAEDKGLTLELELPDSRVRTPGDVSRLQRVVANLLDNAIKFTPRGGRVVLSLAQDPEGTQIRVADNGPGIPSQNLEKVFDRFYRSDLARSTPGSGLGLSLVQALVQAHGGRIEAESEPGQGAVFTVHLPYVS